MGRISTPQYWVRLKGAQPETFAAFNEFANYCRDTLARVLDLEAAVESASSAAPAFPAKRQTVLTGDIDTFSQPAYLDATGGFTVASVAAVTPLRLTWANGFGAGGPVDYYATVADGELTWTVPPSTTSYLYVDRSASGVLTTGEAAAPPAYSIFEPTTAALPETGTAISGGDFPTYPAVNAFDGNPATEWNSLQTSPGITGVSYIGLQFGAATQIETVTISQNPFGNFVSLIQPRWSSDGSTWTDIGTPIAISTGTHTFSIPAYAAATYFSLEAADEPSPGSTWTVYEIIMYGGPPASPDWFDLNTFQMKTWDGSAWQNVVRLYMGRAVADGSGVTSLASFAIRGEYDSGWNATSLSVDDVLTHYLGIALCDGVNIDMMFSTSATALQDCYPANPYYVNAAGDGIGYMLNYTSAPSDQMESAFFLVVTFPGTYVQSLNGTDLTSGYYRARLTRTW